MRCDLGPIKPRLHKLGKALAVTSLGSPWWVDRLVLWQPVKRVLKTALLGTLCAGLQIRDAVALQGGAINARPKSICFVRVFSECLQSGRSRPNLLANTAAQGTLRDKAAHQL